MRTKTGYHDVSWIRRTTEGDQSENSIQYFGSMNWKGLMVFHLTSGHSLLFSDCPCMLCSLTSSLFDPDKAQVVNVVRVLGTFAQYSCSNALHPRGCWRHVWAGKSEKDATSITSRQGHLVSWQSRQEVEMESRSEDKRGGGRNNGKHIWSCGRMKATHVPGLVSNGYLIKYVLT